MNHISCSKHLSLHLSTPSNWMQVGQNSRNLPIYTPSYLHTKRRQCSLIKNNAVGPLLSNSSYRTRIFMGVYLSHFCWHKHAVQQRCSEMSFFCYSLPLNLPLCLRKRGTLFLMLCSALHRGPRHGKVSGFNSGSEACGNSKHLPIIH